MALFGFFTNASFRHLLVLSLSICFSVQVVDLAFKFVSRETTMVSNLVVDPNLHFPDVILCPSPGHRQDFLDGVSNKSNLWQVYGNNMCDGNNAHDGDIDLWLANLTTASLLKFWFDNSTYSAQELIPFMHLFLGGPQVVSEAVDIREIPSYIYGKCFGLRVKPAINSDIYFRIDINFPPGVDEFLLYLSDSSGHVPLGVTLNYWSGRYQSTRVHRNTVSKIALEKTYEEYMPEKTPCFTYPRTDKQGGGRMESWLDCVMSKTRTALLPAWEEEEEEDLCYWPILDTWIPRESGLRPCSSATESRRAFNKVIGAVNRVDDSGDCLAECGKEFFQLYVQTSARDSSSDCGRSMVGLFFNHLLVRHSRQRLMYDFNDILNGAGGSMGLFLGTSFLGIVEYITSWFRRRCNAQ